MAEDEVPGDRGLVLRTPLWHRSIAVGVLLFLAGAAARSALDFSGPVRAGAMVLAAVGLVVAVRVWRLRVEASEAGVLVVDLLRTRQFEWQDIRRVDYEFGLTLLMRDGTEHVPDVFNSQFVAPIPRLDRAVERSGRQLQAALRRSRR